MASEVLSDEVLSSLVDFIIRPPRAEYLPNDLGPHLFTIRNTVVQRTDIELLNHRNLTLHASIYEPQSTPVLALRNTQIDHLPYVIYCHGNGSCRMEAESIVKLLTCYGVGVFAMDFSGSGMSQGEFISLGVYEKYDIQVAVEYLRVHRNAKNIALWGHSMGAATVLMYAGMSNNNQNETEKLACIIVDSAYASFDKLAETLVHQMGLPVAVPKRIVLTVGVRFVKKSVKERAGFSLDDVNPVASGKKCSRIPAIFLHGLADDVVTPNHSEIILKAYACTNKALITEPELMHESPRPLWMLTRCAIFVVEHLYDNWNEFYACAKALANDALFETRYEDAVHAYSRIIERGEIEYSSVQGSLRSHNIAKPNVMRQSAPVVSNSMTESQKGAASSTTKKNPNVAKSSFWKRLFTSSGSSNQASASTKRASLVRNKSGKQLTSKSEEQTATGLIFDEKSAGDRASTKLRGERPRSMVLHSVGFGAESTKEVRSNNRKSMIITGAVSTEEQPEQQQQQEESNDELKKIVSMLLSIYGNRSLGYIRIKRYEEGLSDAERALQLDRFWMRGYQRKAQCLIELGRIEEAKSVIEDGLKLEVEYSPLIQLLDEINTRITATT